VSFLQTAIRSLAHGRYEIHHDLPKTESLKDCMDRTIPYYQNTIYPQTIAKNRTVLIASSENAIRGLLMHLCDIPIANISNVEIPTGVPLLYHLDADQKPLKDPRSFGLLSGAFLGDPEEIKAAQAKVAAQTKVHTDESPAEVEERILAYAQGKEN